MSSLPIVIIIAAYATMTGGYDAYLFSLQERSGSGQVLFTEINLSKMRN